MTTQQISIVVAERIKNIAPAVSDKVVEHLVNKELTRRSEAVIQGFGDLDKMKTELKKIKPDVVSYNLDGSVANSNWTKATLEAKNKLEQKMEKLTKALDKALVDNDYSDLYNIAKPSAE
jgi:hypothetical protein